MKKQELAKIVSDTYRMDKTSASNLVSKYRKFVEHHELAMLNDFVSKSMQGKDLGQYVATVQPFRPE